MEDDIAAQLIPFPGGEVMIFTNDDGEPVVSVDYLGIQTMVAKATSDSGLGEKTIVQIDGKPGSSERSMLIFLNNTTVFRGDDLPDGSQGFDEIVGQIGI